MLAGAGEGWKKRKLMDGTEDGMDKLAVHEEAQAFVRGYAATHRVDHESDKYDFLTMAVEDEDESGDEERRAGGGGCIWTGEAGQVDRL